VLLESQGTFFVKGAGKRMSRMRISTSENEDIHVR
jgi:hypothetical protein